MLRYDATYKDVRIQQREYILRRTGDHIFFPSKPSNYFVLSYCYILNIIYTDTDDLLSPTQTMCLENCIALQRTHKIFSNDFFNQKREKTSGERRGVFKILIYVLFICAACQSILFRKRGILI